MKPFDLDKVGEELDSLQEKFSKEKTDKKETESEGNQSIH